MARISSLIVLSAVTLASFISSVSAANNSADDLGPSNANCSRATYPITVSSSNILFRKSFTEIPAGVDAATLVTSIFERFIATLPIPEVFASMYEDNGTPSNVTDTYNISGILCTPKNFTAMISPGLVQLLIHGGGFDARYWDFRGPGVPEYFSYVYAAAAAGFTTFRYDRLGTGLSDHPADAFNIVQGATDVAIAEEFARKLRLGNIGATAYSTVVVVGHSYGSIQSTALIEAGLVDHAVLTGFTADTSGVGTFLAGAGFTSVRDVLPNRFGNLTYPYLAAATPQSAQLNFLHWPTYTQAAANLFLAIEEPTSLGALIGLSDMVHPAINFTGSVAVVTGEADFPFCSGNCSIVPAGSSLSSKLDTVKALYPAVTKFATRIPKETGHGIQIHTTAPESNQWIQNHIASL